MNKDTPSLSELVDRSRKFLEQPHTLDVGDVMQLVADMRKALSRLMAQGGLVEPLQPSASLEEKISKIIEAQRSSTDGPQRDDWQRGYAAACRELRDMIIPLLQASAKHEAAPTPQPIKGESDLEKAGCGGMK